MSGWLADYVCMCVSACVCLPLCVCVSVRQPPCVIFICATSVAVAALGFPLLSSTAMRLLCSSCLLAGVSPAPSAISSSCCLPPLCCLLSAAFSLPLLFSLLPSLLPSPSASYCLLLPPAFSCFLLPSPLQPPSASCSAFCLVSFVFFVLN